MENSSTVHVSAQLKSVKFAEIRFSSVAFSQGLVHQLHDNQNNRFAAVRSSHSKQINNERMAKRLYLSPLSRKAFKKRFSLESIRIIFKLQSLDGHKSAAPISDAHNAKLSDTKRLNVEDPDSFQVYITLLRVD